MVLHLRVNCVRERETDGVRGRERETFGLGGEGGSGIHGGGGESRRC